MRLVRVWRGRIESLLLPSVFIACEAPDGGAAPVLWPSLADRDIDAAFDAVFRLP